MYYAVVDAMLLRRFVVFLAICLCVASRDTDLTIGPPTASETDIANQRSIQRLLLVATLDGSLHAVNRESGAIQWSLRDVAGGGRAKIDVSPRARPNDKTLFLPDPRDGSLFYFNAEQGIRRLRQSIPELVDGPSRSADGLFYTSWRTKRLLAVDLLTGTKTEQYEMSGTNPSEKQCPFSSGQSLLLEATEFHVSLYNPSTRSLWNATYIHYDDDGSDNERDLDLYEAGTDESGGSSDVLLASSSSGRLVSKKRGQYFEHRSIEKKTGQDVEHRSIELVPHSSLLNPTALASTNPSGVVNFIVLLLECTCRRRLLAADAVFDRAVIIRYRTRCSRERFETTLTRFRRNCGDRRTTIAMRRRFRPPPLRQ